MKTAPLFLLCLAACSPNPSRPEPYYECTERSQHGAGQCMKWEIHCPAPTNLQTGTNGYGNAILVCQLGR